MALPGGGGGARSGRAAHGGRAKRREKLGGAGVRARKTAVMEEERPAAAWESPEVSDRLVADPRALVCESRSESPASLTRIARRRWTPDL